MSSVLHTTRTDATASAAIGFAPIAGVPPVLHRAAAYLAVSGTPDPLQRKGSKFNQLAPQVPERLSPPCSADGIHGLVERAVQGKTKPPAK